MVKLEKSARKARVSPPVNWNLRQLVCLGERPVVRLVVRVVVVLVVLVVVRLVVRVVVRVGWSG